MQDGILFNECIAAIVPDRIVPKQIIISSEGKIDRDEICYLCNLQEHVSVSHKDIVIGLSCCTKKKQFDSIFLAWDQDKQILYLHFVLSYRIKKIHFGGVSYDVETYKRLYGAEKYELFNLRQHTHGMQSMLDYLHSIGYWDACIQDSIVYDQKRRYITIFFKIYFGTCYSIKKCNLILDHSLLMHKKRIFSLFEKQIVKSLQGKKYNHLLLNNVLAQYITQLQNAGFLCENLLVTEKIDTATKTIAFEFTLHPRYPYRILCVGNRFFSQKILYKHLEMAFHAERMVEASMIEQELVELYKHKGFLDVQVNHSMHHAESRFIIQEGDRFVIQEVHISFLEAMKEKVDPFRVFLSKQLYGYTASRDHVFRAISACLSYMNDAGFLDAQLVRYSIEKKNHGIATVHIYLDPKEQKIIDTIELQSKIQLPCLPTFSLSKKTILNPCIVTTQKVMIEKALQQCGYLHAVVFPEIHAETLRWNIHPRQQTTIGSIIIQGNPELSFLKIGTLVNIPQKTYWQQTKIQEAIHTLQKLGIYERVELYSDPAEHAASFQPIIMHLIPDDPCELRLRLGGELQHIQDYQSFDGISYKIGCSFIIKNIAHLADKLQCDIDIATTHREILASWSVPFSVHKYSILPLANLWHVKTQGYHMRFDNPGAIGYTKNIYTIGRDGFLISVGNIKDASYLNINIGFEQQKTSITDQKNAVELARALNFDVQELSKPLPYALFDINFLFNFLDHAIYPTRGVSSLCGIKTMLPFHDFSTYYVKLMFQQIFFFSLFDFIFGLRARFGYLFHKDFSKITPAERFYLGGSHSVRGYEADYFPPISPFIDTSGKATIVPRGGKIMANVNIEMTKRVWYLFSIALFHDIGALADDIETATAMVPLHASGFGIRFETPFGPLRFDIGWKWKKTRLEERNYAWYLSFGRSF